MLPIEKLLTFFRSEFRTEENSGFAHLKRIPDSRVEAKLGWYQSLSPPDKASFVDCCAHFAVRNYGFVALLDPETRAYLQSLPSLAQLYQEGLPHRLQSLLEEIYEAKVSEARLDHTKHPFFSRWADVNADVPFRSNRNVPMLRAAISQYKIDRHRGVPSCVSEDLFRFAESVKSIKAPELRKRVRATLNKFGYEQTDPYGGHRCIWDGQEFEVNVDFGARNAQLRYSVTPSEFRALHPRGTFCFEVALGMGFGHWNYIVKENVDDVFLLFEELIKYAVDLPRRMREAISQ
jgi:hypothetical protein